MTTIEHQGICEDNMMKDDDHRIDIYYHPDSPELIFEVDTWFAKAGTPTSPMRSLRKTTELKGVDNRSFGICEITEFAQLVAYVTFIIA